MDSKLFIFLLLGVSLLAFGCAGKKAQAPQPTQEDTVQPAATGQQAGAGDTIAAPEPEQNASMPETVEESSGEPGSNLSDLADLFQVDTDKPLEGEGFDIESPKSNKS